MPSIREDILDNLAQSLASMSQGEGFNFDWKACYRDQQTSELIGYPACMIEVGRETVESLTYPAHDRSLDVVIHAVHRAHRDGEDTPGETASALIEDIERLVAAITTQGGGAWDTLLNWNERAQVPEPDVYVLVGITIHYQTSRTDPAAKIGG